MDGVEIHMLKEKVVLQGAIRKRVRALRKIRSLYEGYRWRQSGVKAVTI